MRISIKGMDISLVDFDKIYNSGRMFLSINGKEMECMIRKINISTKMPESSFNPITGYTPKFNGMKCVDIECETLWKTLKVKKKSEAHTQPG